MWPPPDPAQPRQEPLAWVAREACRCTGGATTPRHGSWKASIFCLGILERPLLTARGRRSGFRRPAGLTTNQAQNAIIALRRDHLSGPAIARRLRHVSGDALHGLLPRRSGVAAAMAHDRHELEPAPSGTIQSLHLALRPK